MIDLIFENTGELSDQQYWTSTSKVANDDDPLLDFRTHTWTVEFNEGVVNSVGDKDLDLRRVRAVRGPD